jgi:hypothetical protein
LTNYVKKIVQEATPVDEFGSKADTIINKVLDEFAKSAPDASSTKEVTQYETSLVKLEAALDAPLQVLYWKQLN